MADFTVRTLVERTRRWMVGMHGVPLNALHDAVDDTVTTITLAYDPGVLVANTYVGVDDEMVYIWELDRGSKTAVVSRGQLGTDAAAHDALAVVESASRFPRTAIKDSLVDEINSWPNGLYKVKAKVIDLAVRQSAVDIGLSDGKVKTVLAVDRAPRRVFTYADKWSPIPFRWDRLMPRDIFPSGTVVTLDSRVDEPSRIRVLYGAPFDLEDISDDVDVVDDWGLTPSMCDIPPIGAAARLIQGREIERSDTSDLTEGRIAADVPATYQTQTSTAMRLWVTGRIGQEVNRLRADYRIIS